jgi:tetratricopeptide (TPR) repeat protein
VTTRTALLALTLLAPALAPPPAADPPAGPARLALTAPAGSAEGRRGNAAYAREDFAAAADHYRAALDRAASGAAVRSALLNNLGAALLAQDQTAAARESFEEALAAALTARDRARAAYNAGNAAAALGDAPAALALYRAALLAQPDFPEARHNYEVIARLAAEAPPPAGAPPEPSAFAREVRAEAEALVARRAYAEALATMEAGLREDPTVAAFQDFIDRLEAVVSIDRAP